MHITANAVINALANGDNRYEVGKLDAELINEEPEEINRRVMDR